MRRRDNPTNPDRGAAFYCVPNNFALETDNGDGEWKAIVKWQGVNNLRNIKVTAVPDKDGAEEFVLTPEDGAEMCELKMKRYSLEENNAYTHWWDDEKGTFMEPIIYTFNVEAEAVVGDRVFTVHNSAKEIILNKTECIRDHEFNVYRVVSFGGQVWTVDDFRASTYIDADGNVKNYQFVEVELPSGAKGRLYEPVVETPQAANMTPYHINEYLSTPIKGYHMSTKSDWCKLEAFYGRKDSEFDGKAVGAQFLTIEEYNKISQDLFQRIWVSSFVGVEEEIAKQLVSPYDWLESEKLFNGHDNKPFNARPWGVANSYGSSGSAIGVLYLLNEYSNYVAIWYNNSGVSHLSADYYLPWGAVRFVKD